MLERGATRCVLRFVLAGALSLSAAASWSYTEAQAAAGRAAYAEHCAICHGAGMRQLPDALVAGRESLRAHAIEQVPGGGSPRGVPATITPEIRPPRAGHALYVLALPEP